MKDVYIISSPPRTIRLAQCRSFDDDRYNENKNAIMESIFDLNPGKNTLRPVVPSCFVGRQEGRGGTTFPSEECPPLPMSFEQHQEEEEDEEACIGGYYYNMNRPNNGSSVSYKQKHELKAQGCCASSSTDICKRIYPFPFVLMCLLFLFGIGEMLRKVGSTHDDD